MMWQGSRKVIPSSAALLQDALEFFVPSCELEEDFFGSTLSFDANSSFDGIAEDSDDVLA